MSELYVKVALPIPLRKTFDYRVSPELREKAGVGKRVSVPFKNYEMKGFIVDFYQDEYREGIKEIKDIIDEESVINEKILNLCNYLSEEYFLPIGQLLRMSFSPELPVRKKGRERKAESEKISVSSVKEEIIEEIMKKLKDKKPLVLSGEREIRSSIYIEIARKLKMEGKRAIFVFPEIIKANSFYKIEKNDLKQSIFHSAISPVRRSKELEKVISGEIDIVIGTPQILFSPVRELGLIVLDEEESRYFKMEENPKFHALWVAEKKSEIENCSLLLGTILPTVETFHKIQKKEYQFFKIPTRKKVEIEIIKDRAPIPFKILKEIRKNLKNGNQVLFLTVRKGMGSILICKKCGWISLCPKCKVPLKAHEEGEQLCHICGWREPFKLYCPECNGSLSFIGAVGTERISQILREKFPRIKVGILDLEKTRTRRAQRKVWEDFYAKKINILVGTQLILTSREEFQKKVKLMVMVKPEANLLLPDVNFSEATFHLINDAIKMVEEGGKVIIVSEFPEHHSIKYLVEGTPKLFYEKELKIKKALGYPPFGRIAKLILSRKTLKGVGRFSRFIFKDLKERGERIEIIGPSINPYEGGKKKSVQIIIKGEEDKVKEWLKENIEKLEKHSIEIDIDPTSIF